MRVFSKLVQILLYGMLLMWGQLTWGLSASSRVSYNSGTVALELPGNIGLKEVRLYQCNDLDSSKTGADVCIRSDVYQNPRVILNDVGRQAVYINERGVSLVQVEGELKAWNDFGWRIVEYSQLIFNQVAPSHAIDTVARQYNPVLSFHPSEAFFPIDISRIFDLPMTEFGDTNINYGGRYLTTGWSAKTVLSQFSDLNNYAFLDPAIAMRFPGDGQRFPSYYLYEEDGENLWITYIYFFGYDQKKGLASVANHALDRESVSIQFVRRSDQWIPKGVVYAGHLPTQPTRFAGAQEGSAPLASWTGGKTYVSWENASKTSDGRLLAYVALGSHAMFPASGWYQVVNMLFGAELPGSSLWEPAGGTHSGVSGDLQYLNVSTIGGLIFSGVLIDGPGSDDSRLFPFMRSPISKFFSTAGTEFNDCVAQRLGCQKYINRGAGVSGPNVVGMTYTPESMSQNASLVVTFDVDMNTSSYSTGGFYIPDEANNFPRWTDSRTFEMRFVMTTPGGTITLGRGGFISASGETLIDDVNFVFPLVSSNLFLGSFVTDSCTFCTDDVNGAASAWTDGNASTRRSLNQYSGSLNIFLSEGKLISSVLLVPDFSTPIGGEVSYEVQISPDARGASGWDSVAVGSSQFLAGVGVRIPLSSSRADTRVVKVIFHSSPAWIGFLEVAGY